MQPLAQQKFPKEQIVIFFFFLEGKWKTFEVKHSWAA